MILYLLIWIEIKWIEIIEINWRHIQRKIARFTEIDLVFEFPIRSSCIAMLQEKKIEIGQFIERSARTSSTDSLSIHRGRTKTAVSSQSACLLLLLCSAASSPLFEFLHCSKRELFWAIWSRSRPPSSIRDPFYTIAVHLVVVAGVLGRIGYWGQ